MDSVLLPPNPWLTGFGTRQRFCPAKSVAGAKVRVQLDVSFRLLVNTVEDQTVGDKIEYVLILVEIVTSRFLLAKLKDRLAL